MKTNSIKIASVAMVVDQVSTSAAIYGAAGWSAMTFDPAGQPDRPGRSA
jgi:hypothetical protein